MTQDNRQGTSARTGRLLKPALSYISVFVNAMQEGLWDPKKCPDGWIPLVVAENKLNNDVVLQKLTEVQGYPTAVMNYSGMKGIPGFQLALARLLERFILPGHTVDPDHLCISSGCSAVLDELFYCLCDDGDGVLIPAPYYPAFENDLQAKCCVHPLPFFLSEESAADPGGLSIAQQLDAAVDDAASFGVPVKALLVTNPNNPMGTIYSDDTVRQMLAWCLDRKVHYVSDEVYALSAFKPHATFTSAITLAQQLVAGGAGGMAGGADGSQPAAAADGADGAGEPAAHGSADPAAAVNGSSAAAESVAAGEPAAAGDSSSTGGGYSQGLVDSYVHLIYGLSKDRCGSGLRVGMLYSRNARLQAALSNISMFASVSNYVQYGLAQVLSDHEWAAGFLQRNQRALEGSYDLLTGALTAEGIPFLPAVAGMFVWVDLRKWLAEPTWEAETEFWRRVCDRCKVIITPGKDCRAAEPGFFRLCFAWVPPKALPEAVRRIKLLAGTGSGASDCSVQ